MTVLAEVLDDLTAPGELYEKLPGTRVRCFACGHRCLIRRGRRGICQVRFNQGGELRVPWGYVAALQVDPIEKKPFFHFLPGADVADLWHAGLRFPLRLLPELVHFPGAARPGLGRCRWRIVRRIIAGADRGISRAAPGAAVIASSYNEPLITSEWAVAIFRLATAGRAEMRLYLQRQCHTRGAGLLTTRISRHTRSI